MGRKQKKLWKHILLFPAICLIVLNVIIGCRQSVERPDLSVQQAQPDTLPKIPSGQEHATKLDRLEVQLLDQADASMKNGEVVHALQSVAESISCCEGHFSARAFGIIETALAQPDGNVDTSVNAVRCLRRMKDAVTKFGYGPETGCWVTALSEMLAIDAENQRLNDIIRSQDKEIRTLTKQMEQLKAVDLEGVQTESAIEVP